MFQSQNSKQQMDIFRGVSQSGLNFCITCIRDVPPCPPVLLVKGVKGNGSSSEEICQARLSPSNPL